MASMHLPLALWLPQTDRKIVALQAPGRSFTRLSRQRSSCFTFWFSHRQTKGLLPSASFVSNRKQAALSPSWRASSNACSIVNDIAFDEQTQCIAVDRGQCLRRHDILHSLLTISLSSIATSNASLKHRLFAKKNSGQGLMPAAPGAYFQNAINASCVTDLLTIPKLWGSFDTELSNAILSISKGAARRETLS